VSFAGLLRRPQAPSDERRPAPRRRTRPLVDLWITDLGPLRTCFVMCKRLIYVCVDYISSPYLLVFGDDRVRSTREQMILQVVRVRLSYGARIAWEFYVLSLSFITLDL